MAINKNYITDVLEYLENFLTDCSSFEELFENVEKDKLLELIDDADEKIDMIESLIEEEEYTYFMQEYLLASEFVLKNLDDEDFFNFVYELIYLIDNEELLDEKENVDLEEIKKKFGWK